MDQIRSLSQMIEEARKLCATNGFVNNACALFGTTKIASNSGHNTGPPAENAYAVEPVGVEIITPSHPNELTGRPSTSKIASNTPDRF